MEWGQRDQVESRYKKCQDGMVTGWGDIKDSTLSL